MGWWKWKRHNHSADIGCILSGVISLSVGVDAHRGGLVGYPYQPGEVNDLHVCSPLARVLSNLEVAAIIARLPNYFPACTLAAAISFTVRAIAGPHTRQGISRDMTTEGYPGRMLVDNVVLRRAVAAFAAQPNQRGAFEVLRLCMYGDVLLDVTGSDALTGEPFAAGSHLQIRGGTGPNGGSALFCYTRNEEIARLYPPGTATQSLVQPATGALELARSQGNAWLYIDPAGPTCALSAPEIDFALRNGNNTALKQALADHADGKVDRQVVVKVLRDNGPMVVAADDSRGAVDVRITTHPNGTSSIFGFTSAPEVVAFDPTAAALSLTIEQVVHMAREQGHTGIVINPAGPFLWVSLAELLG